MTLLVIVVLAVAVIDSRDRVRRDVLLNDAGLRAWYDDRYTRRGIALNRENLNAALRRTRTFRRWGPVALSAGTMGAAIFLTFAAASTVPGMEQVWRSPARLADAVSPEVLVQTTVVYLLLPILVVEGVLAVLYVADLDISRLQRLLDGLD